MLNEAATKIVARAARAAAAENRDQVHYGVNVDQLVSDAWQNAQSLNPDFLDWPSAQNYFEAVFYDEISRE